MKINEKLYELRKEAHLSQEETAEKLGVTRQTISKWETGESSPDIDKILPICNLYHIDTEELFKGIKKEEVNEENKEKTAFVIALSVFLYFLSVIWIILAETQTNIKDEIVVSIFLLICALPTCYLIYYFVSLPKKEKIKKEENKVLVRIKSILSLITLIIYLLISFTTMKWGITWIIWIIYAIIEEIVETIFTIKEEKHENECH